MPPSQRITIRLSPDLAARLAATVGPRGTLADTVRHALEAYLEGEADIRQPWQTPLAAAADVAATLADIRTRLAGIEQRLEALEALAASRQPAPRPRQPQPQRRQPAHPRPADTADTTPLPPADTAAMADTTALDYDPTRFALGLLCPRDHEYQQTGQTLRRLPSHVCPACDVEQQRARRQAQREGRG